MGGAPTKGQPPQPDLQPQASRHALPAHPAPIDPTAAPDAPAASLAGPARSDLLPLRGRVVHLVGEFTPEVGDFLAPATHALASGGLRQCVVSIDERQRRFPSTHLHPAAERLRVPALRNPVAQWRVLAQGLRRALHGPPLSALHLHGLLPGVLGSWVLQGDRSAAPVVVSPHGSRTLFVLPRLGARGLPLLRHLLPARRDTTFVHVPGERRRAAACGQVDLIEIPVARDFLDQPRQEAPAPRVVTGGGGRGPRAAARVAQLAVLFGGGDPTLAFHWIGPVDLAAGRQLNAVGVTVSDAASDADRAGRLGAGWLYLAPEAGRGFPMAVVQAMAAGLPVVALDCLRHREVLQHGVTGFLCADERELIDRIALLIDNPELRARMGAAARADAAARFDPDEFERRLLAAYARLHPAPAAVAQTGARPPYAVNER